MKTTTSYISPKATIGKKVTIGHFCVIKSGVVIGDNCVIEDHVIIESNTKIGNNTRVSSHTILGKQPKSLANFSKITTQQPGLVIKNNCYIGSLCVFYAGSKIGHNSYIADKVSIREGVIIGSQVRIGRCVDIDVEAKINPQVKIQSGALIADRSILETGVYIGAQVTTTADKYMSRDKSQRRGPHFKRYCRIGSNATILPHVVVGTEAVVAGGATVANNVPPKLVVAGNPARPIKKVQTKQLIK